MSESPRIVVTPRAAAAMVRAAQDEGLQPIVRVQVRGGGCAGFTYDLHFTEASGPLDEAFVTDGATVVVDPVSLQYLDSVTIDYDSSTLGSTGFKFLNPNSTGSCGCGKSFST